MIESGHSRFPVIGDDRDQIVGILLAKDLLRYFSEGATGSWDIREVLRPAAFVPESKRLNVLLKEFRVSRNHMAIVVDEYGGVSGLVTIEDVIEEIVGEIADEYDTDEDQTIRREGDRQFVVLALTRMQEFNEYFGDALQRRGIRHDRRPRDAPVRAPAAARGGGDDGRTRIQGAARRPAPHRPAARDDARAAACASRRRRSGLSAAAGRTDHPDPALPRIDRGDRGHRRRRSRSRRTASSTSALLGPAVLFLLWEYASPRDAARTGFWFGAALFGAGTWWIYTAIHDFGEAPAWLALFLLAALLAIKGAYYALLGYVLVRVAPDPSPSRSLLLIPAGWTLMEWLRGWLFTGFPWLQLGYAHSDTPLAALATVGGIHLVTFAAALTASAIVVVFHPGRRAIRGDRAHGARLGRRLAAHRARVDEAREQAGHRCAPAGRDPAEREMARRESRSDARQVPRR